MAPAGFTSGNLEIGGLRFHYADWGGGGPPLVMLHGLSGHARTWDDTAAPLSGRYHVLAWISAATATPAGRRNTASARWQRISWASSMRWSLREVTLMGLSMGGIVSFVFAAAHPGRVRRLWSWTSGRRSLQRARANVAAVMAAKRHLRLRGRSVRPGPRSQPAAYRRESATGSRIICARCRTARSPSSTTRRSAASPARARPHSRPALAAWRSVRCPVLLVRGEDSDILAAETAQRMLAENPNASLACVPECGHSITLDNPDGLLEVVSPWLAAAEAGRAASA